MREEMSSFSKQTLQHCQGGQWRDRWLRHSKEGTECMKPGSSRAQIVILSVKQSLVLFLTTPFQLSPQSNLLQIYCDNKTLR